MSLKNMLRPIFEIDLINVERVIYYCSIEIII